MAEHELLSTGIGAATGLISGMEEEGLTAGRNNMNAIYRQIVTKFKKGAISHASLSTAFKMFAGHAADTNLPAGTVFGGLFNTAASSAGTCGCH